MDQNNQIVNESLLDNKIGFLHLQDPIPVLNGTNDSYDFILKTQVILEGKLVSNIQ